jgi:hypothetical protein
MQGKSTYSTTAEKVIIVLIIIIGYLYFCKNSYAIFSRNLNIEAEAEFKFSDFQRDPKPTITNTGSNFSQRYRLYLSGGVLKQGALNSFFGVSFGDKYRKEETDFENDVRFDYGRWLRIETLSKHETDEEIFFSGTPEPQSPIHSVTKRYSSRLAINSNSSIEYSFEQKERKDLLLGTLTGERTSSQNVRFKIDIGPLNFNSEYRKRDLDDLLGVRSDIESRDLNFEFFYRPRDYFNVFGYFEDSKDADIDNNTQLESKDYGLELALKLIKELKVRNKWSLREDKDTRTGEDISNKSGELILDFQPHKQVALEFAYKREDEDKERDSIDIDSTIDEGRFKMRLTPIPGINIQTGYEISDKSSTSSTENIKNTKIYSDISLEPIESFRLGGSFANTKQKNTFTSLVESDTKSISGTAHYRLNQRIALFAQLDTTKTDNPSTGAFTKTNTISSNLYFAPFEFLDVSLRTSAQKTTGTSESALSKRLLNSVEFNIKPFRNLKFSTEYELINSAGPSSQDEDLIDISAFYNIGKFDFSLRFQEREASGDNPTDKTTILSNIKYSFSKDAVFSFRFSLIDYTDEANPVNSYDSTSIESMFSLRF